MMIEELKLLVNKTVPKSGL